MPKWMKSAWTYYYLLIVGMFALIALNHSSFPNEGTAHEKTYFTMLWLHFVFGSVALLIGPMQFLEVI